MANPDSGRGESETKSYWAEWHVCTPRGGIIGSSISQGSPEKQNQYVYIQAYPITKACKSHSLPSASWRTRKAGGVAQSESEALRTGGRMGWGGWYKS